jgi:hypothetical protein
VDWRVDAGRSRAPGRGAYLCSAACAGRVVKNRRYPGLAAAAREDHFASGPADVYDGTASPRGNRSMQAMK